MSTTNTALVKRSFKVIEIPLNKFKDEAIPHYQELFLKHKANVHKLTNTGDYVQLDREIRDSKRIIRQLKELMYELDTLRTQVEDFDLDKFDIKTVPLRKIIIELTNGYSHLEVDTRKAIEEYVENKNEDISQYPSQIQIQDDIEALKLYESENQFKQIKALNNDIEDVHDIFLDLNKMVENQKEQVNIIESNTEVASSNIKDGLLHLIKAAKLQKASYPVAGAFIGTLVGGPIGSVAGLKVGGLAAVGCGIMGYVSGRFFRKVHAAETSETLVELETTYIDNRELPISKTNDKKDI